MKHPKFLIVGPAGAGKTTAAETIAELTGCRFKCSTKIGIDVLYPFMIHHEFLDDEHGFIPFDHTPDYSQDEIKQDIFNTKSMNRGYLASMWDLYNHHDKAAMAREVLKYSDIYAGMRRKEEIEACLEAGLFDYVIYIRCEDKHDESFTWSLPDFLNYPADDLCSSVRGMCMMNIKGLTEFKKNTKLLLEEWNLLPISGIEGSEPLNGPLVPVPDPDATVLNEYKTAINGIATTLKEPEEKPLSFYKGCIENIKDTLKEGFSSTEVFGNTEQQIGMLRGVRYCLKILTGTDDETVEEKPDLINRSAPQSEKLIGSSNSERHDPNWEPKKSEKFWYVSDLGNIIIETWRNLPIDEVRFYFGNVYKPGRHAGKALKRQKAYARMVRKIAELNDGWWPDFNDGKQGDERCFFDYTPDENKVDYYISAGGRIAVAIELLFKSEVSDQVLKECAEDFKIWIGVE